MNSSQIHVVEIGKKMQLQIDVPTKKGIERRPIPESQASLEIKDYLRNPPSVKSKVVHVEFEMEEGQAKRVRLAGQMWIEPRITPTAQMNPNHAAQPGVAMFENPYNFIPTPPRDTKHESLGDAEPAGHHRYHADKWSGRISVELTTVTPLLISDEGVAGADKHKTFGIRKNKDGSPYLPPTSIKGALRATYEAVTNSRMGVLEEHDERLPFRMDARDALQLVPCRVVSLPDGKLGVQLLPGLSTFSKNGNPLGNGADCLMYAAWLHRYKKYRKETSSHEIHTDKHESSEAIPITTLAGIPTKPQHGDHVFVRVSAPKTHRSNRFSYLQIEEIQHATGTMLAGWHEGWVYVSGPNIMNKHEEKIFIEQYGAPTLPLTPEVMETWKKLITNYQAIHAKELQQRRDSNQSPSDYLGHNPGETGYSRHVFHSGIENLKTGDLCYAKVKTDINNVPDHVVAIYPVAISRDLYSQSPDELLPKSLNSADSFSELSPADRVFGWVNKSKHGQFKGQLRIGTVTCQQGSEAIEKLANEQPLAILGAPKPAQARFYASKTPEGNPLDKGGDKAQAYNKGQGLRGRKFYPYQKQAALNTSSYWDASTSKSEAIAETMGGQTVYREWQRLAEEDKIKTEQNRTIKEWVKPEMTFKFDVEVTNLSGVELGALLWLFNQPDQQYFRLGGGKPLGFGSTKLQINGLDLRDGEAIREDYASFGEVNSAEMQTRRTVRKEDYASFGEVNSASGKRIINTESASKLIDEYKNVLPAAVGESGQSFEELKVIKAFVNAARGGDFPVHYPRSSAEPNIKGENFTWFVANEKRENKFSLPDLATNNRSLPIF